MPKRKTTHTSASGRKKQYPVLSTKLYIPRLRPYVVSRPRLLEKLNKVKERKLALISAPAGFGKTTLLSDWINQAKMPAAWISLDAGDNDIVHFLIYLIASLHQIKIDVGRVTLTMLETPQPPPVEIVLAALINDIASIQKDFALVLDDYHLVTAPPVQKALLFLLEHLPRNMHLVITTRSDPPLPLGRLRSLNQMVELRGTDLCFTTDETSVFFNKKLSLGLSHGEIVMLESRTEGWIAGLQLAALSMQGREDMGDFIKEFKGDNRYIFDYLMEEVLNRQPEHIQSFLIQTSILDRLSGPLCDAVTGQKNSQQILNDLEKADLFIFPLDDERKWFRYHHLFADLLEHRLQQTHGDLLPELRRRAGEWCIQSGMKDQAVNHAIAAGDTEWAARLIEEVAEDIWDRGQQAKLLRWFEALPDELIDSNIQLCILYARALNISGHQEAAEKKLQIAERLLESAKDRITVTSSSVSGPPFKLGRDELKGRIAVILSFVAAYKGDMLRLMQHARQAMESLHEKDLTWRAVAAVALGFVHGWSGDGDLMSARYAFSEAKRVSEISGNSYFYLYASSCLAGIDGLQGRLKQAEETYQYLLNYAEENGLSQTSMAGSILGSWGGILCEWNKLEEGIRLIEKGIKLAALGHDTVLLASNRIQIARASFLTGDFKRAQKVVQEIEKAASEFQIPPWLIHWASALKAEIWLASGDMDAVSRWVKERGLDGDDELTNRREHEHLALARFLIAQDRLDEAEPLLTGLIRSAESGTRVYSLIQMRLLKALTAHKRDDKKAALDELRQALYLGGPGGFIRSFIKEGSQVAELLEIVHEEEKAGPAGKKTEFSQNYIKKLLVAFKADTPPQKVKGLVDPLSEREVEVLTLLAGGLSNQEIARKLFISLNTVRTHTKNINSKLNVHSRTQAAARAKELGLI